MNYGGCPIWPVSSITPFSPIQPFPALTILQCWDHTRTLQLRPTPHHSSTSLQFRARQARSAWNSWSSNYRQKNKRCWKRRQRAFSKVWFKRWYPRKVHHKKDDDRLSVYERALSVMDDNAGISLQPNTGKFVVKGTLRYIAYCFIIPEGNLHMRRIGKLLPRISLGDGRWSKTDKVETTEHDSILQEEKKFRR